MLTRSKQKSTVKPKAQKRQQNTNVRNRKSNQQSARTIGIQASNQPSTQTIGIQTSSQVRNRQTDSINISKDEELKEQLDKVYKNIASAPNYSAKITDFLRQHDVHGVHRRITKKKFPRRKVIARFPLEVCMADLIEYPQYKYVNNGYCFILILIDCFTKMVYAVPMKKKNKEWTADAFESIFKQFDEYPINLVTDGGLEFFNSSVRKVFDTYGINHYKTPTRTKWKASVAERAIRTLKSRLEKYFKTNKTRKWTNILAQFVKNYNSVPHSSHGLPPQDVSSENREYVYKQLYPHADLTIVCKLKVGDRVRKIREKSEFEKGYTENWSEEIYIIHKQLQSNLVCWYKIKSQDGKVLPGIWYYYQLNLVARNDHQPYRQNS